MAQKETRIAVIGTDIQSWQLGSYQIRSVAIDNKCGSWLWIPQDNTYVPPYTLGFHHNFSPSLLRIDIRFVAGPAGQVSTQNGDNPSVTVSDEYTIESAGASSSAFIEGFTPTETVVSALRHADNAVVDQFVLISPSSTTRIRLYYLKYILDWYAQPELHNLSTATVYVYQRPIGGGGPVRQVSGANLHGVHKPVDQTVFSPAYDLPVGYELWINATSRWAVAWYLLEAHYQIV